MALEVPKFFGGWRGTPEPSAVHALAARKKSHLSWMIFAIMRSANTNKGDDGMYDTTIAAKLLSQLESFLVRISPRFHKPTARFIGDMVYGIMAQKDIKLSFSMTWIGNSQKHKVIAHSIALMSFRIHGVPAFHFYSIADGTSDILKRGRRWRGFDPKEAEKKDDSSLFDFFGLNTG